MYACVKVKCQVTSRAAPLCPLKLGVALCHSPDPNPCVFTSNPTRIWEFRSDFSDSDSDIRPITTYNKYKIAPKIFVFGINGVISNLIMGGHIPPFLADVLYHAMRLARGSIPIR